jgi:DNA/RNA-binding domain of Phe-tRNA-synthetase-like protein
MLSPMSEAATFQIHPWVQKTFPTYRASIVALRGAENRASDEEIALLRREAEERLRARLNGAAPSDVAEIATWRAAFSAFGLKPSRYPCSVEALAKRVAKGDSLPAINALVDIYNVVSIDHLIPIGGEDIDCGAGVATLRPAVSSDTFDLPGADGVPSAPEPGEVIWADDLGVTCRGWNWRQGLRTRLTEATQNAYFLLEALGEDTDLSTAVEDLLALLERTGISGETQLGSISSQAPLLSI